MTRPPSVFDVFRILSRTYRPPRWTVREVPATSRPRDGASWQ